MSDAEKGGHNTYSPRDAILRNFLTSECGDLEAGNALKVLHVDRGHVEAQMQGRSSDHEVPEVDDDALGRLLAFDTSGKLRDLQRHRMHDQIVEDALGEDAPPRTVGVGRRF